MNRIAELRKKLGLTQTRLGEEIGVSQQTISKYECNRRTPPDGFAEQNGRDAERAD